MRDETQCCTSKLISDGTVTDSLLCVLVESRWSFGAATADEKVVESRCCQALWYLREAVRTTESGQVPA